MKRKYAVLGGLAIALLVFAVGIPFYNKLFAPSIKLAPGKEKIDFYVYPGDDYAAVANRLLNSEILSRPDGFQWMAERMNYIHNIHPGRYILTDGMSNRELVTLLRSGKQTPVRYTFVKYRTIDQLATDADSSFAFQKQELLDLLENDDFLSRYGFNRRTVISIFIPNTYEFYWTVKPKEFFEKMLEEYRKFWNKNGRVEKGRKWGLDRIEIMTLASIVEEESNKNDEKPALAGVYLNRIRQGMPLQADPTVKFAIGDFSITRITEAMTHTNSPYNTYQQLGLPPGPICTPSIPSIDAVLSAQRHDYLYFCARPDGSGYHQLSKTYEEHTNVAAQYHRMLNQRGIK